MVLTIITINRNNAAGLEKTMQSVLSQTRTDFEYVVVDGASADGSVEIIRRHADQFGDRLKWISEPDKGIYNAMNKGIRMASGEYLEFLNSGDCLVSETVIANIDRALKSTGFPSILYGNMLKDLPKNRIRKTSHFSGKEEFTLLRFYFGTLNHSSAFIRKSLFDKYGLYDESLKIVSDWKWFLQAIILGEEKPICANVDVSLFDMTGVSETNPELTKKERKEVLSTLIPTPILADYDEWAFQLEQMNRLKRYPWAYKMVWFLERCLFKLEKWKWARKGF